MASKNIITHSLKEITNSEILVHKFIGKENDEAFYRKAAHKRLDHYVFIFQKSGSSKLVVDFKEYELKGSAVLCILPGQVHYGVDVRKGTEVWLITLDSAYVDVEYKKIFSDYFIQTKVFAIGKTEAPTLDDSIQLLASMKRPEQKLLLPQVTRSMINACIGIFASIYYTTTNDSTKSRTFLITKQFHHLLAAHYQTKKKITDYSKMLHISAPYLNEAVKKTTGHTSSYWIQQTIITEAKRLLYNTEFTVKEVAYELGFADHGYFSRYFTKAEKISPVKFRSRYR